MKKLDSYRLLDLFIQILLTALTVVFIFMVSLGYFQIGRYAPEISPFPYFLAFLPSFLAPFIHSIINYFGAKAHGHPLIELSPHSIEKQAQNGLYVGLASFVISLIFILLFLFEVLPGEEYLYVIASFPMGLFPYAFFLFSEIIALFQNKKAEKKILKLFLVLLLSAPIAFGIATYLPGALGWSYMGIAFLPLSLAIGDASCLDKKESDIVNLDDI